MLHQAISQENPLFLFAKQNLWGRISASEMPSLFFDGYQSRKKLFETKTRQMTGETGFVPDEGYVHPSLENGRRCEALAWTLLEENLADYLFRTFRAQDIVEMWRPGIYLSCDNDFMCCSPDGVIDLDHKMMYGIEIKTPFQGFKIPKKFSEIPSKHLIQCYASITVTGFPGWFLFYYDYVFPKKSVLFTIPISERISDIIKGHAALFKMFLKNHDTHWGSRSARKGEKFDLLKELMKIASKDVYIIEDWRKEDPPPSEEQSRRSPAAD